MTGSGQPTIDMGPSEKARRLPGQHLNNSLLIPEAGGQTVLKIRPKT